MGQITDKGNKFLEEAVAYTLELVGEVSVGYIKKEIAIAYPPASSPENPPHRRTGLLMAGIHFEDHPDENKVTIISDRVGTFVPGWLEFGTKKMTARPYMTPAKLATIRICADAVRYGMNPGAAAFGAFHASNQAIAAEFGHRTLDMQ